MQSCQHLHIDFVLMYAHTLREQELQDQISTTHISVSSALSLMACVTCVATFNLHLSRRVSKHFSSITPHVISETVTNVATNLALRQVRLVLPKPGPIIWPWPMGWVDNYSLVLAQASQAHVSSLSTSI